MNHNRPPTGVRRFFAAGLAYVGIGFWMLQDISPWRRRYGKRR
jgi:hypothetical protein